MLNGTELPSTPKSLSIDFPYYLFGAVSQSYLKCSLLGSSPHFSPNKTQLTTLKLGIFLVNNTHTHTHTHITQLHSSISEHLVCFQVLDIVNKTTMNMGYRCLFKLGFLLFLNIFQEAKARFSDPNFSDLSVLKLFLKAYISLGFGLSGHTQTTCCQCSLAKDY